MPTPTQRLASTLLGRDVLAWLDEQQAKGLSLRQTAELLAERTNGQVKVSNVTILNWIKADDRG
jgi:hypothetical protein